jgi:hypothetical protein
VHEIKHVVYRLLFRKEAVTVRLSTPTATTGPNHAGARAPRLVKLQPM